MKVSLIVHFASVVLIPPTLSFRQNGDLAQGVFDDLNKRAVQLCTLGVQLRINGACFQFWNQYPIDCHFPRKLVLPIVDQRSAECHIPQSGAVLTGPSGPPSYGTPVAPGAGRTLRHPEAVRHFQ